LKQVAEYMGLAAESLLSLVNAGLLSAEEGPNDGNARMWVFRRETLPSQMRDLLAQVSSYKDDGAGTSLQEAMRTFSWVALCIPEVLSAVTSGQLPAYLVGKSKNFKYLRFDRATVVEYAANIRRDRNAGTLSAMVVMKILKCRVELLQRLHTAGLRSPVSARF
jgi:hypothetical protein